jgi:hypothetical protein
MSCLSLPRDQPIYETTPVLSSIHPSLANLYPTIESLAQTVGPDGIDKSEIGSYLTLVLVCRSKAKGDRTRELLLKEHEMLLKQRAKKGVLAIDGWWEELDIQIQTCDQSTLGGDNGVLALCERLRDRYAQLQRCRVIKRSYHQSTLYHPSLPQRGSRSTPRKRLRCTHQTTSHRGTD